jgi:dipeptidyl aminopeptidase/acylaminoacyl peptidase
VFAVRWQVTVLVYAYSDVDPGTYSLYEPQSQRWKVLGQIRPEINVRQMGNQTMHRFTARDGHNVPVWVTLPRMPAGKKVQSAPAVVLVHGGPYLRGTSFGFDEEAQFLASRGYVVIQPEFRGSEGYGTVHFRAGWKQWGLKMQDDISDSLKFAVSKGWVDPARVCIMGGSYGGYATLMGLAKDPDQYKCGVAFASVSDPRNVYDFFWSDETGAGRRYSLPLLVGDRVKDEAILKAGSPLEQVGRIKAPLLLMHGALDRRVPIDNAERMLSALRAAGKPVEWVRYPDEGHGFEFDNNRYAHYRRVEAFLAQHLKP